MNQQFSDEETRPIVTSVPVIAHEENEVTPITAKQNADRKTMSAELLKINRSQAKLLLGFIGTVIVLSSLMVFALNGQKLLLFQGCAAGIFLLFCGIMPRICRLGRRGSPLRNDVLALLKPATETQVAFRVEVINVFAKFGDEKCVPILEKVARENVKTEGGKRLQRAAQKGLPLLRERVRQQTDEKSLLRAAAPDGSGTTLLRPANETTNPKVSTQLLRPTEKEAP